MYDRFTRLEREVAQTIMYIETENYNVTWNRVVVRCNNKMVLGHHAVVNYNRGTTRLCVVFDGSNKT